jgi:hypothetical protein
VVERLVLMTQQQIQLVVGVEELAARRMAFQVQEVLILVAVAVVLVILTQVVAVVLVLSFLRFLTLAQLLSLLVSPARCLPL